MSPVKLFQLDTRGAVRAMVGEEARRPPASLVTVTDVLPCTLWGEDVRERGVRVPTLQAHRSAVRLPGAVSGRGGSTQSSLGHRGAFLPVSVGVMLPVGGSASHGRAPVELLLHPHIW